MQKERHKMNKPKIIIDAGHGGEVDWGLRTGKKYNKGWDGCTEKQINLEIANRFAWFLARHQIPYIMTRWGDRYLSLQERCTKANSSGAILFVSIHCNFALDKRIKGVETYHYRGSHSGKAWAIKFQDLLIGLDYTRNRGVKESGFYVLKHTNMPAILLELGYLSNRSDCKFLNSPSSQDLVAEKLFEVVRTIC